MGNKGSTPLHEAAGNVDISKLRWAVQQHPQLVNKQEEQFGWTPLHIAAFKGSDACVRELVARGATPDLLDKDGRSALHLAALQGSTDVAKALIRAGAQREIKDLKGAYPYDYAVQKNAEVAALLGMPAERAGSPVTSPQATQETTAFGSSTGAGPAQHLPHVQHATAATTQAAQQLLPPQPPSAAARSSPKVAGGAGAGLYPRIPITQAAQQDPHTLLQPPPPQPATAPTASPLQPYPSAPIYAPPPQYPSFGAAGQATVPTAASARAPQQQPPGPQWPAPSAPAPAALTPAAPPPPQPPRRAAYDDDDWGAPAQQDWGGSAPAAAPAAPAAATTAPAAAAAVRPAALQSHPVASPRVSSAGGATAPPPPPSAPQEAATAPPPASRRADKDDDDDGWGAPATEWGGEPVVPELAVPGRAAQPRHFNPIQSARWQLQQLLGLRFNQQGPGSQGSSASSSTNNVPAAASAPQAPAAAAGGGLGLFAGARMADTTHTHGPAQHAAAGLQMQQSGGGGISTPTSQASNGLSAQSSGAYSARGGRLYSYDQLKIATANFSPANYLGQGGFGPVYRGMLDGIPVAIKALDDSPAALQGMQEFTTEASTLSRLHHPHIVLLIGTCPDKGMLVYEFMSGGSLDEYVFSPAAVAAAAAAGGKGTAPAQQALRPPRPPLVWQERVRIAAEVASALLFLHSAQEPIVHMDIKPSNILLDGTSRTAKLGDVGLCRILQDKTLGGRSIMQDSRLVGTPMYMDPVYMRTAQVHASQDVYSLGMVMLQLLTGHPDGNVVTRVEEARGTLSFADVIDPAAGAWPAAEAAAFADLALKCVEFKRQDRPDLRSVLLPALTQLRQRTMLYPIASAPPAPGAPAAALQLAGPQQEPVPAMFLCPITQDVMDDPVFAADGYTYERLAIQEWVQRSATSPLTNMALGHTHLTPNHTLRSAIKEWREKQQRK